MSGVARYYAETVSSHPQGAFVLYEDYAALLERIAALEGDARRMDWLARDCHKLGWSDDGEIECIAAAEGQTFTGSDYREAIDAALDAARVGGA